MGKGLPTSAFRAVLILTFSLALCLSTAQLRAQIAVCAPTLEQARTLQNWYDKHIPARFRADSPVSIRELSDDQMDAYLRASCGQSGHVAGGASGTQGDADYDSDIDGVYEGNPDCISLRIYPDGQPDFYTFAHEFGHYVWFHMLRGKDRQRYEALYKRQRATHHLVTDYAATNVQEGFAEAFSFYAAAPAVLKQKDRASFNFLAVWSAAGIGGDE